jgi:hypothetical protein
MIVSISARKIINLFIKYKSSYLYEASKEYLSKLNSKSAELLLRRRRLLRLELFSRGRKATPYRLVGKHEKTTT